LTLCFVHLKDVQKIFPLGSAFSFYDKMGNIDEKKLEVLRKEQESEVRKISYSFFLVLSPHSIKDEGEM